MSDQPTTHPGFFETNRNSETVETCRAQSELSATPLLDRVNSWLETWSPNCGAPRAVFEGQFRVTLREIFDEIERRAEANMLKTGKLEGMHYAALKDVRRELSVTRSNVQALPQPGAAVVECRKDKQNE